MPKKGKKLDLPSNLDWDLLRNFSICAKSKSFSEASRTSGIKPSSFTTQMRKLEEFLGVELFKRIKGTMVNNFTPEGYELLKVAKRAEKAIYQSGKSLEDEHELKQEIKIYTTNGIASTILPEIVDMFCNKFPNVNVHVLTQSMPTFLTPEDIVIRVDFKAQSNISKIKLIDVDVNFYASKKYIKRFGYPASVQDIEKHRFLFAFGSREIDRLGPYDIYINRSIVSSNIEFSYKLCEMGQCIIELTSIYPGAENLVKVLEGDKKTTHTIFLYHLEKHKENSAAYWFIKEAQEYAEKRLTKAHTS